MAVSPLRAHGDVVREPQANQNCLTIPPEGNGFKKIPAPERDGFALGAAARE
ncbi:MAG TPA: hypothetical protein VME68_00290 [Acidobacteriaceae bacterium]|nr:hypothetical protein [Acidobacteriaceae bacterium]